MNIISNNIFNSQESIEERLLLEEATINYHIDILPGIVGWVIGRSGCRIKYIQQECGCKMWIDQDLPDHQPRKLYLQGTKHSINMALNILSRVISEAPLLGGMYGSVSSIISRTGEIPPEYIGLLIGKKGWTIKKIQAESGAQLAINQSVRDRQPRKIIVSGDKNAVEMAIRLIKDSLKIKSRRDRHLGIENSSPVSARYSNSQRPQERLFNARGREEHQQHYSESDYISGLLRRLNISTEVEQNQYIEHVQNKSAILLSTNIRPNFV